MAYVALALVLGAGGAATALPGTSTVDSGDIVDGEVRAKDLRLGAVGSAAIANDAVSHTEIADASIGTDQIGTGEIRRDHIDDDAVGDSELGGQFGNPQLAPLEIRFASSVIVPGGAAGNGSYDTRTAKESCDAGEIALGGGLRWSTSADDQELVMVEGHFTDSNTSFTATGGNDSGTDRTMTVQVLCLWASN